MEKLLLPGRCFYGIGIAGIGIQQFIYSEFRPMLIPWWPASFPGQAPWAYITGAALILAGALIIFNKKTRIICLSLGLFFLLLFLCFHVYYQLFVVTGDFELASWSNPLKELAFAGGAFILAVSFTEENPSAANKLLAVPGRVFFSIMLIIFGIDHFLYARFVALLVPGWVPGHMFWTYFSAVALIGSGVCFLFGIKVRLTGILCGIMLLLWFILLHIPRAIADPGMAKGNEITSVFQALAFSGIAFVIASLPALLLRSARNDGRVPRSFTN
jgi:uncharacterized membrane protein YphA (DoxX/SURF4 family)